jgi:hypothetical protein
MRGSEKAPAAALLKEQRRRDCARRHWRSYRGRVLHRQRFPGPPKGSEIRPKRAHKALMRLNFRGPPAKGLTASGAQQI